MTNSGEKDSINDYYYRHITIRRQNSVHGKKILKCKQKGDIYIYDIKNKCIVYSHESDHDEHSPSFSKDGSKIVYSSRKIEDADDIKDNITHLRIVDLNDKTIEEITSDSYRSDYLAKFSPDNTKIVFDGTIAKHQLKSVGDIYVYNISKRETSRITNNAFEMLLYPNFFGNSSTVIFNIQTILENNDELEVNIHLCKIKDINSPTIISLTNNNTGNYKVMYPSALPDGRILCTAYRNKKYELVIFDGSSMQILSTSNLCFSSPVYCEFNKTFYWINGDIEMYSLSLKDYKVNKVSGRDLFKKTEKFIKL